MNPTPAQIKAERRRLDHNQTEAAASMGRTKWTWSLWERGKVPMDPIIFKAYKSKKPTKMPVQPGKKYRLGFKK
jgi:hypothetical protein